MSSITRYALLLATAGSASIAGQVGAQTMTSPATSAPAAPAGSPATGSEASATGEASDSDIVVTGYRAANERAQAIKRNASSVVEAVTLQDLGKFSDINIADVLQRVPGVQIERNDSGVAGDRASIRGLGPSYVQVLFDGRIPLTGGNEGVVALRQVNLDVLPTEIIAGLLVYKTPTAELVEPGIAGSIDVQTLKPLDYRNPHGHATFGTLTVRGDYDNQADRVIPRISGVVGTKLLDDTLGLYVSGIWSRGRTNNAEFFSRFATRDLQFDDNGDGNVDRTVNNVLVPSRMTTSQNEGTIKRLAFSGGVQWRPNDRLEINANALYSKFYNDQYRSYGDILFNGANSVYSGIASPGGYVVENGLLKAIDTSKLVYAGTNPGVSYDPQPLKFFNDQRLFNTGLNVKYTADRLTAIFDYGYSKGDFDQDLRLFAGGTADPNFNVQFDGRPEVPILNGVINTISPAGSAFPVFFGRYYRNRSHSNAFKLDLKYDFTPDIALKIGSRYQDTRVNVSSGSKLSIAPDEATGYSSAIAQQMATAIFPGGTTGFLSDLGFGLAVPKMSYLAAANLVPTLRDAPVDSFSVDPAFGFTAKERVWATYVQGDAKGELGAIPFEGNVGVRAVHVSLHSESAQTTTLLNHLSNVGDPTVTPTSDRNDYWRFLPAANINLHLTPSVSLRLGVSRVMSRPEYEDTAPRNAVFNYDKTDPLVDPSQRGTATIGNTALRPLTAWQYDVSLELDTGARGAVYASLFYKDVKDFILRTVTLDVPLPNQIGDSYDVTGPVNASSGNVKGFEIGIDQPLLFLPAPFDGFGVQANYTYVDSKINLDNSDTVYGFPGASKHNANATIYFEKESFSTRLAYSYRSNYFQALGGGNDRSAQPTFTRGFGQLNASISYDITPNLEVSLTGVNLTKANRRDYVVDSDQFRSFIERSRVFSLSVRASY